jgi:hypothetical protein
MEVLYRDCACLEVHKSLPPRRRGRRWWPASVTWRTKPSSGRSGRSGRQQRILWCCRSGWRARVHAHRDGGDRRLLEADLACFERWRFLPGAGQCRTCQERPGAQDRCQRRHLAGRPDGLRPDPRKLRAGCPDAGAARPAAHRKQLVRERSSPVQRLQETLEDANFKLDTVISDIIGLSGRAMVAALTAARAIPIHWPPSPIAGSRPRPAALREALRGRVTNHHRFLLPLPGAVPSLTLPTRRKKRDRRPRRLDPHAAYHMIKGHPSTTISVPTISTAGPKPFTPGALSLVSKNSVIQITPMTA